MAYYPWFFDKNFYKGVLSKKEINDHKLEEDKVKTKCLEDYQYIVSNYINPASPYGSLLLYMMTGVGKSFSAISIAENFIRNDKTKQVLVITKSKTLINNFISDLIHICSNYATQTESNAIKDGDEKIRKLVKSRIKRNYTFITYNHLKDNKTDFTNKIVIIDEIHNLLGNTGYNAVMKSITNSKRYRLVLLSATPVYDNIADVFQLSNILNGKTSQFNTTNLSNYIIQEEHTQVGNIFKNKVNRLTKLGSDELVKRLTGKIFYLKVDKKDFPSVSYPKSVKTVGDKKLPIGVIPCMMSGIQERYYTEATGYKVNSLGGQLESMSSIIYPDFNGKRYFGKAGMDLYIKGNENSDFLLESNVAQYSCKLYNLLQNIKLSKGKIYIHSNSITDDGAPLIAKCLRKNGYSKIAVLTSNATSEFISKTIDIFNHPSNDNGEKVNIIIGSGIISEGITLKSVRQAHIYEPEWNYSRIDQITGRVIRKGSHASLPISDRNVQVYLYCAISSNLLKSVDFAKYYLSSIKDLEIKKLERTLAKSAFSCGLTKSRNIVKNKENGSRECEYQDCDYACDNDPEIDIVDTSTYNVFLHDKELYNELSPKILKVFGKTNSISLKDLSKLTGISQEILINIMKNKPPVSVTYKNGIFSVKNSKTKAPEISKVVKKKSTTTGSSSNVRGFINEAGFFSLETNKSGKLSKKICTTGFDKQELTSMVLLLGLDLPQKPTKKSLCEILHNHYLIS